MSNATLPTTSTASATPDATNRGLKFHGKNDFQVELKKRVDQYFKETGHPQRDCPQMYLKTAILLGTFATSYCLLVFVATAWWQSVPLALLLGLTTAAIGFNIQHDAGHHGYSNRAWVNKMFSMTLDLIGGSSYVWHYKHGVLHHTYVNIAGHDTDIDMGIFGRLSPAQKRYGFHRWQHLYLWVLYGLLAIKWHLWTDFHDVAVGAIGDNKIPRPKGWDLVGLIAGKAVFFTIAFVLPMMFHPVWLVLLFYVGIAGTLGIVLSIVFQLAHAVEDAEFPAPSLESGRIENAWAIHQVETTVDFTRRNPVVSWLLGGLNFQIEHHLLPKVCHINYPRIAHVVEGTCRDYGVRYTEHESFSAGLASHFRWLKEMGKSDAPAAAPSAAHASGATARAGASDDFHASPAK